MLTFSREATFAGPMTVAAGAALAAALAGQLEVSLLDGHLPRPEDELVVAAAAVSGRFANAGERLQLSQGAFAVRYEADRVVLSDFDATAVALRLARTDADGDAAAGRRRRQRDRRRR